MKTVRHPKPPPSIPHSTATRELDTFELATSWVDGAGMISVDEGIERVFRAACVGGCFRVNVKVRGGVMETLTYRDYPRALYVTVKYIDQGRRPMLYAATHNRDALIAAKGHKTESGFVSSKDATADVLQHFLNIWCEEMGIKNTRPAPIIDTLRSRKRIKRERL